MALLLLFALIAGAGTALSPCVLPILPALLSAGATGGRRRPFGIVLGLAVTFTITIVGLAEVVDGVGLGDGSLRSLAVLVLLGFGVLLLVPRLSDRVEALLSPLIRLGPKTSGDGFVSGIAVGAALGFVYAPCAGPILAAVISVSAASGETVAVAIAYAVGSAAALLALSLVGRRLLDRFRGPWLQRVLGIVMVLTALAIATDRDVAFQNTIADDLPGWLVNPTGDIERSTTVAKKLDDLRGESKFAATGDGLPELGNAPEFAGVTQWLNSKPLTLASLRGRVVLIDFWTYTCINCLRTLPYLKRVGRALPRPRAHDRRRPHAGVRLREGHRQRRGRDRAQPPALPGRTGQRLRHLGRLGQPVLAGQVPDRHDGPGPLRALRRGRLRQDRGGDPLAATGQEPRQARRPRSRARCRATRRRRPTSAPPARRAGNRRRSPARTTTRASAGSTRTASRSAGAGPLTTSPRRPSKTRRCARTCAASPSTSCSADQGSVDVSVDGEHEKTVDVDGQRLYELHATPAGRRARAHAEVRAGRRRLCVHVRLVGSDENRR